MTASRLSSLAFQPTLPSRGATLHTVNIVDLHVISTHAPLAGSDLRRGVNHYHFLTYFNPRSPRGERREPTLKIRFNIA